jgi:hypothetical protein
MGSNNVVSKFFDTSRSVKTMRVVGKLETTNTQNHHNLILDLLLFKYLPN